MLEQGSNSEHLTCVCPETNSWFEAHVKQVQSRLLGFSPNARRLSCRRISLPSILTRQAIGRNVRAPTPSSPHRDIALVMMHVSWPTSQWTFTTRAQIVAKTHRIAKVIFRDAHSTAQIACFGLIYGPAIARFTSWVAKAHHIANLHRAIWRT